MRLYDDVVKKAAHVVNNLRESGDLTLDDAIKIGLVISKAAADAEHDYNKKFFYDRLLPYLEKFHFKNKMQYHSVAIEFCETYYSDEGYDYSNIIRLVDIHYGI